MKKEVAEAWVADLRNPENKQAQGFLKHNDAYCCLGRLCVLAGKKFDKVEFDITYRIAGAKLIGSEGYSVLTEEVREWAGMNNLIGDVPVGNPLATIDRGDKVEPLTCLTDLNDNGFSFAEIADIIEKRWEEL